MGGPIETRRMLSGHRAKDCVRNTVFATFWDNIVSPTVFWVLVTNTAFGDVVETRNLPFWWKPKTEVQRSTGHCSYLWQVAVAGV